MRCFRTAAAGCLATLLSLPGAARAQGIAELVERASTSAEAGDHGTAAQRYDSAYARSGGEPVLLFLSAQEYTRAGGRSSALARLERMVEAGLVRAEVFSDSAFATLRADPGWTRLVQEAERRRGRLDQSLRTELLALAEQDQANRAGLGELVARFGRGSPQADSAFGALTAADSPLHERLRAIVAEHGWPQRSLVGDDGAHAAWLVLQHMPAEDQQRMLPGVEQGARIGEARPGDAAYLLDRVRVGLGQPQRYGTQLRWPEAGGPPTLFPIEDEPCVDVRRARALLEPLAHYLLTHGVVYQPPPGTCPSRS